MAINEKKLGIFGQQYRLRFIEFCLDEYGTLNRSALVRYFGLSVPQASIDIAAYTELAPNNLVYDRKAKTYRRSDNFERVFP